MLGSEKRKERKMADESKKNKRKEAIRAIKFTLFSISAGVIEIVVFTILEQFTNFKYWPCYLIALICSVVWNFTLNRQYTFQSANNIPIAMLKVAAYYCVFTPITTIGGNYLAETLGWNDYIVTAINMILNFVTEFIYDRIVVFGKSIDTNKRAKRADDAGKEDAKDGSESGSTK